MNKERRADLADVSQLLQEAMDRLDEIRSEEQYAYESLPENFQFGTAGNAMQDAINMMDSWEARVNDIIAIIDSFSSGRITTDQANMTEFKYMTKI